MAHYRPRRASRPAKADRIVRLTVPAVVVGALATGVAVAAWPGSASLSAVPAPDTSIATPATRALPEQVTRDQARPAPQESAAAPTPPAASATTGDRAAKRQQAVRIGKPTQTQRIEEAKPDPKPKPKPKPEPKPKLDLTVTGTRYLTEDLNVRTDADSDAKVTTVLEARSKVQVTETIEDGFRLIVRDGKGRWVTNEYLSKKKPEKQDAISDSSCDKSSSIEGGLVPNGVKVYRALCARFPNITSFGGRRPANGGFHPTGQAVDAMISKGGWEVARWLRANADELGVSEVIYSQQIWTVQRSSEGWRGMSDAGSATANHYDHVHVSVY